MARAAVTLSERNRIYLYVAQAPVVIKAHCIIRSEYVPVIHENSQYSGLNNTSAREK
jgi:hypothetical protein